MARNNLNIGFVRRGFSQSGGAEAYLRRLARGVVTAGHEVTLFSTTEWPESEWPSPRLERIGRAEPLAFADELERLNPQKYCDVLVSLERIWRCDFFRAGDGVHRAWLERKAQFDSPLQKMARRYSRKHAGILQLEQALLGEGGARRVIANSALVRDDIMHCYGLAAEAIDVVRNGVRVSDFGPAPLKREAARAQLNLRPDEIAVLFSGSGWERKGLRYAIEAVENLRGARKKLMVVGRGNQRKYRSRDAHFLGELNDVRLPLAAADIFLLPTLYDPFSNASLEAMAAGIPVITTRSNGCSEIIDEKVHGSIVDCADNLAALVSGLQFWSDESRRREARSALLERATQFDISRNVAHTLELLLQPGASAVSVSGNIRNT